MFSLRQVYAVTVFAVMSLFAPQNGTEISEVADGVSTPTHARLLNEEGRNCRECETLFQFDGGGFAIAWGDLCVPAWKDGCAICEPDPSLCTPENDVEWDDRCENQNCLPAYNRSGSDVSESDLTDLESVLHIQREFPDRIVLNEERGAIQLVSCKGVVLISTAVSREFLAAIRSAL